ncbi:cell envelope integrity protein TolA [Photobacterium profundum]|uniref:cell envelope integrity protein TolA n=1 Tax=Photobacterium profundum TaxID=74109 RepID=UPI003D0ADCC0
MRHFLIVLFIIFSVSACSSRQDKCNTVNNCAAKVVDRIQQNLILEQDYYGKKAVVNLSLDNNSNLEYVEVVENNGGPSFEEAIIKAVSSTFPYEQLLTLSESEYAEFMEIKLTITPMK